MFTAARTEPGQGGSVQVSPFRFCKENPKQPIVIQGAII
jgi:hypothetical protein